MLEAIIYIGIAQCLFAALLIFSKKPLRVADKILGYWLLTSSLLFIYNLIKVYYDIDSYVWQISLSLSITFPTFLVLYSKYSTTEQKRFKQGDLFFFTPFCVILLIASVYYATEPVNSFSYTMGYDYDIWPLKIVEYLSYVLLWIYSLAALYFVFRYKRQINQLYSFDSHEINLSWLLVIIIGYFVTYSALIVIMRSYFKILNHGELSIFINGLQLIFIYVLSYFGLMQQQLIAISDSISPVILNRISFKEHRFGKYQKSSLKDSAKIEAALQKLVECMNTLEPWKDNRLSVAKLSELSSISKHHITQILNDNLQKNFHTFVNEYRTEYAKKLIISPKYSHYSIIAIAYESGFNSKTAFNRFFKEYTGISPSEYKKTQGHRS